MYVTDSSDFFRSAPIPARPGQGGMRPEAWVGAGRHVFFDGDQAEWLYQVTSGVLRLTRVLEDGRRQVIAFGYPGDIVGFPSGGIHRTDCEALTDAQLRPYRCSALEDGSGNPELRSMLLQAALNEIRDMQDHFLMLGRKSSLEKLASFLCVLAKRVGEPHECGQKVFLPMSRADIADFLGLTTETVSRSFTQLRRRGLIEIDSIQTIILLRHDELLALSSGDDE